MQESPETALFLAIIEQALNDSTARPPKPPQKPSDRSRIAQWKRRCEKQISRWAYEVDEAKAFLTDTKGRWAQSRERVCGAAGVDPDMLRERALERLAMRQAA